MVRLIDTLITSDTANTDRTVSFCYPPFLPFFLRTFLPSFLPFPPLTFASLTCHASSELNSNPTPVKTCYRLLSFPKGCMSSSCLPSPFISTGSHALLHTHTRKATTINHGARQGKWPCIFSSAGKPGDSEATALTLMKLWASSDGWQRIN